MGVTLDLDDKSSDIGLFEVWANKIRAQKVIHIINGKKNHYKMGNQTLSCWVTRLCHKQKFSLFVIFVLWVTGVTKKHEYWV